MRIIEQFVQALLSILHARKAGKFDEAIKEIRNAGRYYLKTDLSLILYFNPDQLINHFKDDHERAIMCAELLHELAFVNLAQKNEEEAVRLKILCLNLFTSVIPHCEQFQVQKYYEKADSLIEELKGCPLSERSLLNIESYNNFKMKARP